MARLRLKSLLLAAAVLGCGAIAVLVLLMERTRAGVVRVSVRMEIDRFLPVYDFHEVHTITIHASRERVFRALREVAPDEIFLFRTLTAIRGMRTQASTPILAQFERGGVLLADVPDAEVVIGLVGQPWSLAGKRSPRLADAGQYLAFHQPGFVKMALNFYAQQSAPAEVTLLTETRILATDAAARRKFTAYWTVIYPGSALIREMWLRAVRRRAEQP